jgi:hypothetical protein
MLSPAQSFISPTIITGNMIMSMFAAGHTCEPNKNGNSRILVDIASEESYSKYPGFWINDLKRMIGQHLTEPNYR